MTGFVFQRNMTFEWDKVAFRIDRVQGNNELLLERLADGKLSIETKSVLLEEYRKGAICASTPVASCSARECQSPKFSRPLAELPDLIQKETLRRLHYITAILGEGSPTYTHEYLDPIILRTSNAMGDVRPPSVTSIYRWCQRYLVDHDSRSLVPGTYLRGPKTFRQDAFVIRLAGEAIHEAFRASPKATAQSIYPRLARMINAENRNRLPENQLRLPSLRTIYRMLASLDAFELANMREGKRTAGQRFAIVKDQVKASEILERVEIDHTPLDLFLIDDRSGLPLGRPTLSVAVDHYSRMLLGFHLSFSDPSLSAVIGVLRHAILPKVPLKQVIPNLSVSRTWNCHGRPRLVVVDNGMEFHSNALESIALDLRIELRFCPKHQPRFKGVVERFLKTVNYHFVHQLPGTSLARWHLRGDYDSAKHAILTLAEFHQLFQKWVLDVYAQEIHRSTGETPWERWHEGLKRVEPELPDSVGALQQRIGQVTSRALRHDGILLFGVRYCGPELEPILRTFGAGVRVRVLFDPEDLGDIHVWAPGQASPVCVQALDQEQNRGLTAFQNQLLRRALRERGLSQHSKAAVLEARQNLADVVDNLINSRKQRDRKYAAKIAGYSSTKTTLAEFPKSAIDTNGAPRGSRSFENRSAKGEDSEGAPQIYELFTPARGRSPEQPK